MSTRRNARRELAINRSIIAIILVVFMVFPASGYSQSGDATWLNNMEGLETGIGRSWMAPLVWVEETVYTEYNEQGTPVSEIASRSEPSSTPVVTDAMQTQMLSALIYEFDSAENAEDGIELFHAAQMEQISRDPRNPATNEFTPDLGDTAYGNEGTYEAIDPSGDSDEQAVVYVLVQDGNLIYQVFGIFIPGNHIELATEITRQMLEAEPGDNEPIYDMNGHSTGGFWEKLNAIEFAMPEESTITDLEIYPPADDAVMGDSVVVPQIDLDNLPAVPGILGSWHITYAPEESGVLSATPDVIPSGVFNIELWVMEFQDPTHATAATISLTNTLTEPLGVVTTEGSSFGSDDGSERMTMVSSGFIRDRAIPEGDAAVVVMAEGSMLYAARVYSNGPAPTPLANDLVALMSTTEVGNDPETVDGSSASGGMWDIFPATGDELLYGLVPTHIRYDEPSMDSVATPEG